MTYRHPSFYVKEKLIFYVKIPYIKRKGNLFRKLIKIQLILLLCSIIIETNLKDIPSVEG